MYYTYILKSLKNNDIYIGSTENIDNRIKKHNSGKVKSTKGYRPWVLLETKEFETRGEAFKKRNVLEKWSTKRVY